MKKYIKFLIIIIFCGILIGKNNKLFPSKEDITKLGMTRIIGIDKNEETESFTMTLILNKNGSSIDLNKERNETDNKSEEILSVCDKTLKEVIDKMQSYTDKYIVGAHVAYCLIGEETAKNNLKEIASYFIADKQIRYSAKVYIVKGETSKDFLYDTRNSFEKYGQKLDAMEDNIREFSIVSDFNIIDFLKIITSEEKIGLIPTFEKIKAEENNKENYKNEFDYYGYAIIENNRLIDYLDKNEAISCNFINNKINEVNIVLPNSEDIVSTADSKCKIKFKFNKEKLNEIIVNLKTKNNLESVNFDQDVYTKEEVNKIEEEIESYLGNELKKVINKSQKINVDFLGFYKIFEHKYPYKYKKVNDNWKDIWPNVNVKVNVTSKLERKFDLIKMK